MPAQIQPVVIRTVVQDVPIKDLKTSKLTLAVADTKALKFIKVTVDIEHTYIGDLVVTVKPPASMGTAPVILHNREGGPTDNIKKTYDESNAPGLAAFKGKSPQGTWALEVADRARQDTGKIRSFTLEMGL